MENSDSNRSTDIPIRVSVKSELEVTHGDGVYTQTADGFALSFCAGRDNYKIVHSDSRTLLSASGLIGYEIELGAAPTRTKLVSPFGTLEYGVRTESVRAVCDDGGVTLDLRFVLFAEGSDDIARAVYVDARFER